MSNYSVSDVQNQVSRNLGTPTAATATIIESGSVSITGSVSTTATKIIASYSATDTATYTISGNYIEIDNQSLNLITLSVNSISIPIKSGYILGSSFADFTTFTVTVSVNPSSHQILVGGA